jgi:SAM-dependent methyltransferase
MLGMNVKIECPVCSNSEVLKKANRKTPKDFGFKDFEGISIFSCPQCHAEFAWPRETMNYDHVTEEFKIYDSFTSKEDFEGRLHHVLQCTAHWKDSPVVYHLLSLLNFRGEFLDFAAGSGYLTELARRLGYKVNALEINVNFRKFISDEIPDATVFESLAHIKNATKKFNVILGMHIIEHLPDPIAVLKELRSLLEPQGIAIIVVPNLRRAYYRFGEKGQEIEDQIEWDGVPGDFPPHHITRFDAVTMKTALQNSGFKNIAIGYPLINVYDLFHHGLGDEKFKFKTYFSDIRKMNVIASIEVRLNEMLSQLNLEDLGNTLIALASDTIDQDYMASLLVQSRERVMETYLKTIEEQYEQTMASEKSKDEYIESLKETLKKKDEIIEADLKYIKSLQESLGIKSDLES